MISRIIVVAAVVASLSGCAPQPPEADAEWQPEKIYRTGSNIPARDYGAANIEVGKPDLALEARLDRADLVGGHGRELIIGGLLQGLAPWDAGLKDLRVIERGPHPIARGGELLLT